MPIGEIIRPHRLAAAKLSVPFGIATDRHVITNGSKTSITLTINAIPGDGSKLSVDGVAIIFVTGTTFDPLRCDQIDLGPQASTLDVGNAIAALVADHPDGSLIFDNAATSVTDIGSGVTQVTFTSATNRGAEGGTGYTNVGGLADDIETSFTSGGPPRFFRRYSANVRMFGRSHPGEPWQVISTLKKTAPAATGEQALIFDLAPFLLPNLRADRPEPVDTQAITIGETGIQQFKLEWFEAAADPARCGKVNIVEQEGAVQVFDVLAAGEDRHQYMPRQNTDADGCPTVVNDIVQDDYLFDQQAYLANNPPAEFPVVRFQRFLTHTYQRVWDFGLLDFLPIYTDPENSLFGTPLASNEVWSIELLGTLSDGSFVQEFVQATFSDCIGDGPGARQVWQIPVGEVATQALAAHKDRLIDFCLCVGKSADEDVDTLLAQASVDQGLTLEKDATGGPDGGEAIILTGLLDTFEPVTISYGKMGEAVQDATLKIRAQVAITDNLEAQSQDNTISLRAQSTGTAVIDNTVEQNAVIGNLTSGEFVELQTEIAVSQADGSNIEVLADFDPIRNTAGETLATTAGIRVVINCALTGIEQPKFRRVLGCAHYETLMFVNRFGQLEAFHLQAGRALGLEQDVDAEDVELLLRRDNLNKIDNEIYQRKQIQKRQTFAYQALTLPLDDALREQLSELLISEEVFWVTDARKLQADCSDPGAAGDQQYVPVNITSDAQLLAAGEPGASAEVEWEVSWLDWLPTIRS